MSLILKLAQTIPPAPFQRKEGELFSGFCPVEERAPDLRDMRRQHWMGPDLLRSGIAVNAILFI